MKSHCFKRALLKILRSLQKKLSLFLENYKRNLEFLQSANVEFIHCIHPTHVMHWILNKNIQFKTMICISEKNAMKL